MQPVEFQEANFMYVTPKDWDADRFGECGDLPVLRNEDRQTVTSVWALSEDEVERLMFGAEIELTIYGDQPPVSMALRA